MSDLLTPADVEGMARTRGISMAEVCRRAGIATSIFTRWKKGLTRPNYGNYQRILAVVHAENPETTSKTKRARAAATPVGAV